MSALAELLREATERAERNAAAAMWQERAMQLEARLRALPPPESPADAPQRPTAATVAEPANPRPRTDDGLGRGCGAP